MPDGYKTSTCRYTCYALEGMNAEFPWQALAAILPPKKAEVDPSPAIIDEATFEEADLEDVRARSFPATDFFDQAFASQFGNDDDEWEDEDEDDYDDHGLGGEPECRPQ